MARCGSGSLPLETNALLTRIGRQVATRSEHMSGRAIDVQFPDVPLRLVRNSALALQAGGVGYYPAGKGGFERWRNGTPVRGRRGWVNALDIGREKFLL
jgi:hypothetical protein